MTNCFKTVETHKVNVFCKTGFDETRDLATEIVVRGEKEYGMSFKSSINCICHKLKSSLIFEFDLDFNPINFKHT